MIPLSLACGAALAVHVCLICRSLATAGLARVLRSPLSALRTQIFSFARRGEASDDLSIAAATRLLLLRVDVASRYATCAQALLALAVGSVFYQRARALFEGSADDHALAPSFSQAQAVLLLIGYVLSLLFRCIPHHLQRATLDAWYLAAMVLVIGMFFPTISDPATFLLQSAAGASVRLCTSVVASNRALATFMNVMYTTVWCLSLLPESALSSALGSDDSRAMLLYGELVTLGITSLALRLIDQVMAARCTWETKCNLARSEGIAARSLLNLMCDAVVELDSDLIITDDVPKLTGMLMVQSGKDLKGSMLQEWMPPEVRKAFEMHVHAGQSYDGNSSTGGIAATVEVQPVDSTDSSHQPRVELFHAKMQVDGTKRLIDVEMFHVCFSCLDKQRHLIGIREHTCVPPEGRLGPPSIVDSQSETQPRNPSQLSNSLRAPSSYESSEMGSSFTSSFTGGECVVAVFDILSPWLQILEMGEHWVETCGWPEGRKEVGVSDYLDARILPEFRIFLSDHLNRISVEGWNPAKATVPFRKVRSVMTDGLVSTTQIAVTFMDPLEASDVEKGRYKAKLAVTYSRKGSARMKFRGGTRPLVPLREDSEPSGSGGAAGGDSSASAGEGSKGVASGETPPPVTTASVAGGSTSSLIRSALVDAAMKNRSGGKMKGSSECGESEDGRAKKGSPSEPPAFVKLLTL